VHLQQLAGAIREHRQQHGLSLGELGRRTGLSKTSLMRLESGQANPSLETLWRIGRELGLTIAQLIDPDGLAAVRPADVVSESGMEGRLLAHDDTDHRTEVFELALPADGHFASAAHTAGTTELVYCVTGTVTCGRPDEPLTLQPGDSAQFAGDQDHHYGAGPEGGRLVLVMSYPRR
jgi:transcriptional regulator with XRE-family HTH domain